MSPEARDWLERSRTALRSAELLLRTDPDGAASRAYYAAFYAISALFAAEDKTFRRHSQMEAAVHRDLVKTGRFDEGLGAAYSKLQSRRITGDYGGEVHVSSDEADAAIASAILEKVESDLQQ